MLITTSVFLLLSGCTKNNVVRVTELYCLQPPSGPDTTTPLLDYNYQCKYGFKVGSDIDFIVNAESNTVLQHVVRNDGNWLYRDLFLSGCKVADDSNWECKTPDNGTYNPNTIVQVNAMMGGIYYRSLTNNMPPEFYDSSLVGIAGTLFRWHLLSAENAVELQKALM